MEEPQAFTRFFNNLPILKASDRLLRIFDRGDFYTVHGQQDAEFVAQTLFHTKTVIKYHQPTNLPYVQLTKLAAESFLKDLLLNRQYKIEVYEQQQLSGHQKWTLTKRASPGNFEEVDDLLFTNNSNNSHDAIDSTQIVNPVIASLKLHITGQSRMVGLAFVNTSDRSLGMLQFQDNDLFSNIESLFIQLAVKECIIPTSSSTSGSAYAVDDYEYEKVLEVLARLNVVVSRFNRPAGSFEWSLLESDLAELLIQQSRDCDGDTSKSTWAKWQEDLVGSEALNWLINYLDLMGDASFRGQFQISSHRSGSFMRLDSSAVKALHILPTPQDGDNRNMSLLGLLDKCCTAQGSRLLSQYLHQPLISVDAINERQDVVVTLFEDSGTRRDLLNIHLKNMPDLSKISKRFKRHKAGLKECVHLYEASKKFPGLLECLDNVASPLFQRLFVNTLKPAVADLDKFNELVENTIDLTAVGRHEYRIKAEYDESLRGCQEEMNKILAGIQKESGKVADDLGLELDKKLKIDKNSQYGYFLRISRVDSNVLRGKSKQYHELCTQKSGVFFTNDRLRKYSNDYFDLSREYDKKQSALVKDVLEIVQTYCPLMEEVNSVLAQVDVLCSFAHVAACSVIPFVRPKIYEKGSGSLVLKDSRHPCLEVQEGVAFIENDVEMRRGDSELLLITGPNMGGKSTYIRQIATICLLSQIGSFVPCSHAEIPVFDSILARVGAGDFQMKGISTFMAEMLETANILKTATSDTLVIIDELGRGTSTYDGFGLAWAIAEHLAKNVRSFTLFATHFHELTALSDEVQTVKNLHVSSLISSDGITLLYKVQKGSSDQSFGIHVAELANFPFDVIKMAKAKVKELEGDQVVGGSGEDVEMFDASTRKDKDQRVKSILQKLSQVERAEDLDSFLHETFAAGK